MPVMAKAKSRKKEDESYRKSPTPPRGIFECLEDRLKLRGEGDDKKAKGL